MAGRLIGIAKAVAVRAPLEEISSATVSVDAGIEGDARGRKRDRQVTVLSHESWEDAGRDLGVTLPWTTRRANLLVAGLSAPQSVGGHVRIGDLVLEFMLPTHPCQLMERAHAGLKAALTPEWRGGVCCKVAAGGSIHVGDPVSLT